MTTRSPRPRSVRATTVWPRRVTVEVRQRAQRRLDRVGDRLLVVAHRLDVDELLGQGDDVGREVQVGMAPIQPAGRCRLPPCVAWLASAAWTSIRSRGSRTGCGEQSRRTRETPWSTPSHVPRGPSPRSTREALEQVRVNGPRGSLADLPVRAGSHRPTSVSSSGIASPPARRSGPSSTFGPAVGSLDASGRARLALDVVDTAVRELARLRGWDPDIFDTCRDHVIARDYVYTWDGAWKTSLDRRHQARATYRIGTPDGFARSKLDCTGDERTGRSSCRARRPSASAPPGTSAAAPTRFNGPAPRRSASGPHRRVFSTDPAARLTARSVGDDSDRHPAHAVAGPDAGRRPGARPDNPGASSRRVPLRPMSAIRSPDHLYWSEVANNKSRVTRVLGSARRRTCRRTSVWGTTMRHRMSVFAALLTGAVAAGALVTPPAGAAPTWQPVTNLFSDLSAVGGSAQTPTARRRLRRHRHRPLVPLRRHPVRVVQASTRPAGGTWGCPVDLAAGRRIFNPQLAIDPAGTVTAVWRRPDASTPASPGRHPPCRRVVDHPRRPLRGPVRRPLRASRRPAGRGRRGRHRDRHLVALEANRSPVQAATRGPDGTWTAAGRPLRHPARPRRTTDLAVDPAGNATAILGLRRVGPVRHPTVRGPGPHRWTSPRRGAPAPTPGSWSTRPAP